MSIHNDKSFDLARTKCAAAAITRERWTALTSLSKRELAEVAIHLAALATSSYDVAISRQENDGALARFNEEVTALRENGLI